MDISLINSSSFCTWLITLACPAFMLRSHRERALVFLPAISWDVENLSESLLLLAKVLSCLYSACSVIFLIIWIGISSSPMIFATKIPFPLIPWVISVLIPLCVSVLPWQLNASQVSYMVILQESKEGSDVHPWATGWLWKRSCIQQWKEAILSSLFHCGCVEL